MEPCDYHKDIHPVVNPETGQQEFQDCHHPLARKDGKVILSRHLMSVSLGRWLRSFEIVIYKDGNPQNLTIENLVLTTLGKLSHDPDHKAVILICPYCGEPFKVTLSHKIGGSTITIPAEGWLIGNLSLIQKNYANWYGKFQLLRLLPYTEFLIKPLKSAAGR